MPNTATSGPPTYRGRCSVCGEIKDPCRLYDRQYRGHPPAHWPRTMLYCAECELSPSWSAEPVAVFEKRMPVAGWRLLLCSLGWLMSWMIPHGRLVRRAGIWDYYECRHCGCRQAERATPHLIGPRMENWLAGNEWDDIRPMLLPRCSVYD